jgi:mRNA degradation ribonuclease J1/J2
MNEDTTTKTKQKQLRLPHSSGKTAEAAEDAIRARRDRWSDRNSTRLFRQSARQITFRRLRTAISASSILGGVEEVGRNMSMVEYKDTIVIVDCGIQFTESHTPGIDFILPNTRYLEENKHKIKGVLVTHGHLDHIGAIPYIMPRIGNPQIYARLFTSLMIKKRQEEFPHLTPITINVVEKEDTVTLGELKVRFFGVTHAIPDSMGIIIETPYGDIVHTGDLRLDHDEGVPTEDEEALQAL